MRTHIDGGLTEQFGDKYWDAIPQGTRELVEKRLSERFRRHPYEREDAATNYQRLTFCDVMDYAQIVLKNWQVFEGAFGSRGEVERHFLNLKEYRNALKHAREMNAVERKQGEASVEWLFRILEKARHVAALSEGGLSPAEALESNGQDENDEENGDKNAAPPTLEALVAKTTKHGCPFLFSCPWIQWPSILNAKAPCGLLTVRCKLPRSPFARSR